MASILNCTWLFLMSLEFGCNSKKKKSGSENLILNSSWIRVSSYLSWPKYKEIKLFASKKNEPIHAYLCQGERQTYTTRKPQPLAFIKKYSTCLNFNIFKNKLPVLWHANLIGKTHSLLCTSQIMSHYFINVYLLISW